MRAVFCAPEVANAVAADVFGACHRSAREALVTEMGLLPLEFSDCLLDSPYFRENLRAHERALDQTAVDIKTITRCILEVLEAARTLSAAKRSLAAALRDFNFECVGTSLTDDEVIIANALKEFSRFLEQVEDEMSRMLENANEKFVSPLEAFRREQVEPVKKIRKEFERRTSRFCAAQDRYVGLGTRAREDHVAEAAEALRNAGLGLSQASLDYVCQMHIVQERKKFDLVECVLSFLRAWTTFYAHGQSVCGDFGPLFTDVAARVQRTRQQHAATADRFAQLKHKTMQVGRSADLGLLNRMYTRQGYLHAQRSRKSIGLGSQWVKYYCQYQSKSRTLTLLPYSQTTGKMGAATETLRVLECDVKEDAAGAVDSRHRFVVSGQDISDQQGSVVTHTFQALSDDERRHWVEALGGSVPSVAVASTSAAAANCVDGADRDPVLDADAALAFVRQCVEELERRGLADQGLYRVAGVFSKVKKLVLCAATSTSTSTLDLSDPRQWETKTLASAVKQTLRDLPEPLVTTALYADFVRAVKSQEEADRVRQVAEVIHKMSHRDRGNLSWLAQHLSRVAAKSDTNLMTAANLGVCFGPTLLKPAEETVATIMDIKFCNEVVTLLIEHCATFFPEVSGPGPDEDRTSVVEEVALRGSSASLAGRPVGRVSPPMERPRAKSQTATTTTDEKDSRASSGKRPSLMKAHTQDDLMASLQMMNSLAADLPSSTRSSTHLLGRRPQTAGSSKPPLPKLSTVSLPATPLATPLASNAVEWRSRGSRSPSSCSSASASCSPVLETRSSHSHHNDPVPSVPSAPTRKYRRIFVPPSVLQEHAEKATAGGGATNAASSSSSSTTCWPWTPRPHASVDSGLGLASPSPTRARPDPLLAVQERLSLSDHDQIQQKEDGVSIASSDLSVGSDASAGSTYDNVAAAAGMEVASERAASAASSDLSEDGLCSDSSCEAEAEAEVARDGGLFENARSTGGVLREDNDVVEGVCEGGGMLALRKLLSASSTSDV